MVSYIKRTIHKIDCMPKVLCIYIKLYIAIVRVNSKYCFHLFRKYDEKLMKNHVLQKWIPYKKIML